MIELKRPLVQLYIRSLTQNTGLTVLAGAPVSKTWDDVAEAVGATALKAFPCFKGTAEADCTETGCIPVIVDTGFEFATDQHDLIGATLGDNISAKNGVWVVTTPGEVICGYLTKVPGVDNLAYIYYVG